ncbi:MAG: hypothetical protein M5U28_01845 [Sandaracinaceae bacterium]|nr:hypothetical protein [Sandaracinaceae bacterium]
MLVMIVALGCDGPSGSDDAGADAARSGDGGSSGATIGPEGGTVTSPDGRLVLTIPPGALDAPTRIGIASTPTDEAEALIGLPIELAYELTPDGQTFAAPVAVELRHPAALRTSPAGVTLGPILAFTISGQPPAVESLVDQSVSHASETTVRGTLTHFSDLVVTSELDEVSGVRLSVEPGSAELCVHEGATFVVRLSTDGAALLTTSRTPELSVRDRGSPVAIDTPSWSPLRVGEMREMSAFFLVACPAPGSHVIRVGLFVEWHVLGLLSPSGSAIDLEIPYTCVDCRSPVAVGVHDTVDATEAVAYAAGTDVFGVGEQAWLLAAGAGTAVHAAADGALRFDFGSATDPRYRVQHVRWEDGTDTLVSNGPDGYAVRPFIAAEGIFGFQLLGALGLNITDVDRLPSAIDPTRARNLLAVDNTSGDVLELTRSGAGVGHAVVLDDADLAVAGVAGRTVSVHPTSDGAGFLGATESDLFFFDGTDIEPLGPLGAGLRLMDCEAGICAVPDFGGGEVVIFLYDGSTPPDPSSATRVSLGGAVTVDVRADGRVVVPSSTTRTVHRLTLDALLAVVEDVACAIAASSPAPFHASAIEGTELALVDHGADARLEVVDFTSCTAP